MVWITVGLWQVNIKGPPKRRFSDLYLEKSIVIGIFESYLITRFIVMGGSTLTGRNNDSGFRRQSLHYPPVYLTVSLNKVTSTFL